LVGTVSALLLEDKSGALFSLFLMFADVDDSVGLGVGRSTRNANKKFNNFMGSN
jgi:hypothetical protein